jgi:hypothetical protein
MDSGRFVHGMVAALLLVGAFGSLVFAQTFEATVDRNPVGIGEQFTLSLTLTGGGMGGGKNLQLPDLAKFHVMSGPNQSSSVQIVNGSVSSTVTYSYILQPKEMGKVTICFCGRPSTERRYSRVSRSIFRSSCIPGCLW